MAFSVSIDYGQILSCTRINETQVRVSIGVGAHYDNPQFGTAGSWIATANGGQFAASSSSDASVYLEGSADLTVGPAGGTGSVAVVVSAQEYQGNRAYSDPATYSVSWSAQVCTITFDPINGSVSEQSRSVSYGAAIGTLPVPTPPAGYGFTGWYVQAGTELVLVTAETVCTGNATLYAIYRPMAILRLVQGGAVTTVTNIWSVAEGAPSRVLSVWSVENGTPRQGV